MGQLLYRDISNWNARRIRPLAQGAYHKFTPCGIYWPKNGRRPPGQPEAPGPAADNPWHATPELWVTMAGETALHAT